MKDTYKHAEVNHCMVCIAFMRGKLGCLPGSWKGSRWSKNKFSAIEKISVETSDHFAGRLRGYPNFYTKSSPYDDIQCQLSKFLVHVELSTSRSQFHAPPLCSCTGTLEDYRHLTLCDQQLYSSETKICRRILEPALSRDRSVPQSWHLMLLS